MPSEMHRVVVFGGYGTFGARVSRRLARSGIDVIIAGRDARRAARFAAELGTPERFLTADVTDRASCADAIEGAAVAVNCAGPFSRLGTELPEACLECRCHYVDIADDREYVRQVRGLSERFVHAGFTAAYGCSSLPAISGALAQNLMHRGSFQARRARVTLFIGNDNPKGRAAIESAVAVLGRTIEAPQGTIRGFRDREVVSLPPPFGRRAVYNFESPEYDLFPQQWGFEHVSVKVGFELRLATSLFALCAFLGPRATRQLAGMFTVLGQHAPRMGSSGGAVMTELFADDGVIHRATLLSRLEAQEMAVLPCVLVVQALCTGVNLPHGAVTAYDALGSEALVERLVELGCELSIERSE